MVTTKSGYVKRGGQIIPDCRVVDVGIEGFAECPCQGPNRCEHALPFGYTFLCRHPMLKEMLESAKKTKAEATATL